MKRAELVKGKTYAIVVGDKGLHEAWIATIEDTEAKYRKETSWRSGRSYYETKTFADHNAVLVSTLSGHLRLVRLMDIRQEWTEEERQAYCVEHEEAKARRREAKENDSKKREELIKMFKQLAPSLGVEGWVNDSYSRYGADYRKELSLTTAQLEQLVMAMFATQKENV